MKTLGKTATCVDPHGLNRYFTDQYSAEMQSTNKSMAMVICRSHSGNSTGHVKEWIVKDKGRKVRAGSYCERSGRSC